MKTNKPDVYGRAIVCTRQLRERLNLSRLEFSRKFRLNFYTVTSWEYTSSPSTTTNSILLLIERDHETLLKLLRTEEYLKWAHYPFTVREVRQHLKMNRTQFSNRFKYPINTLIQHETKPHSPTEDQQLFLVLVNLFPAWVENTLKED